MNAILADRCQLSTSVSEESGNFFMSEDEGRDMAENVRSQIRKSGLSLRRVAEIAGVNASQLSRFMRGERDLLLGTAQKVLEAIREHSSEREGEDEGEV